YQMTLLLSLARRLSRYLVCAAPSSQLFLFLLFFFLVLLPPPLSTLFPYTTLFRSFFCFFPFFQSVHFIIGQHRIQLFFFALVQGFDFIMCAFLDVLFLIFVILHNGFDLISFCALQV